MTARITRLRIAGFKSFADPATVEILPGLTGIVGPNGCGKSNVVEALRWAMGESSARALRGGELDDLIFAGTVSRPARNLAEVTLWLEDAIGLAPAPFAESPEIEVTRRAERGSGSEFRVNGKLLRARDVTTMFADLSSGARSSSIVSQNRVGALINARPDERRALLEEAAGITGLHARRHDAELRLRQAESNMARAEDLRLQLEERLSTLGAQTEQARAYRDLSENIRKSEVELQTLLHARAAFAVSRTSEALARIRSELTDATARAADATEQERTHAARIGPARTEVETTRTRLERLRVLLESAVQAEAQADNALSAAKTRLDQGQRDAEAAIQRLAEIEHTLRQDIAEHEAVAEDEKGLPKRRDAARVDSDKAAEHLLHAEQTASAAEETLLRLRMEADASQKAHAAIVARIRAAEAETESLGKELNALSARLPAEAEIETLTQRQTAAEHELALAETAVRNAAATYQDASIAARLGAEALLRAEASVREEQAEHEKLRARIASLEEQEALLRVQHVEATSNLLPNEARHALEFRLAGATQNLEKARTAEEHAAAASTSAERTLLLAASNRKDGAQSRSRAEQDFRQAEAALRRATERHERLVAEHETATRQLLPENDVAEARSTLEIQELAFARLLAEITTLEQQTERVRQDRSTCDARLTDTLTEHTRLNARRDGLGDEPEENTLPHPLLDSLDVPEHLTLAVAAALGEGAQASLGPDAAPRNWFSIDASASTTPLPAGATPVNTLMDVPQELTRFFAALGLVEKDTDGGRLQPHLAPGQCLVANNGALWRWDGYHEAGDQPSRTALILNRRRQVAELSAEIAALENTIPALQSARAEVHARLAETEEQLAKARISREPAERALTDARSHVARCVSTQENASSRLADVARQLEDAAEALADARQRHGGATGTMNALPDAAMLDTAEATARRDKEAAHAEFEASRKLCRERENALDAAKETLRNALARHDTATGRLETLTLTIARLQQDLAQACTDEQTQFGDASTQALTQARADAERLSEECARTSETLERARAEQAHLGEEAQKIVAQLRERSELRIALASRESALLPRLDTARSSLAEARNDERTLAPIPDPAPAEQAAQEARAHVVMARENVERARTELATLTSAAARASERRTELQTRIGNNASRAETLRRERDELSERLLAAQAAHTEAAMLPEQLRVSSASQRQELAQTEALWEKAQADLYRIEELLEDARQECQKQEQRVLSGRENEIRLQERLDQAQAARQALIAAGPPPEGYDAPDDLSNQAETKLRRRLAQLLSNRDALGPVNLRAEQEHREASEQAGTLAREHDDLQSAISRLRGSIGNLNREGRERLQAVFTEVDRHFQLLFSRMFGGGRAHLGLVGSDDPLEAGLEIFAQPPGKKLSTLSLLSGGEQALTAISLIFATFRCHPAPICVLDEVDAPLDDANVERLCGLIRDIALEAQTRFVVVTHHQLTMAHMDRLFGVTMQERGVSQVLSVDLSRATAMIDGAGAG